MPDGGAREVRVATRGGELAGLLALPAGSRAVVMLARAGVEVAGALDDDLADQLRLAGIGTLELDLLTAAESAEDEATGQLRLNVELLAGRIADAARWIEREPELMGYRIGLAGASTVVGAALCADASCKGVLGAIVGIAGRPDLAAGALPKVTAPTLLIVGAGDMGVLPLNQEACGALTGEKDLAIIPGAGHRLDGPDVADQVVRLATAWLARHLDTAADQAAPAG